MSREAEGAPPGLAARRAQGDTTLSPPAPARTRETEEGLGGEKGLGRRAGQCLRGWKRIQEQGIQQLFYSVSSP